MNAKRSTLNTGEKLLPNEYLVSDNKVFFAIMQPDGNFCVYAGSGPTANYGLVWRAQSPLGAGDYYATIQSDGNFCIYKDGKHNWSINQSRSTGNYFLILQDDGNLCVYHSKQEQEKTVNEGTWNARAASAIKRLNITSINYDLANAKMKGTVRKVIYRSTLQKDIYDLMNRQLEVFVKFPVEWQNKGDKINKYLDITLIAVPVIADKKIALATFPQQKIDDVLYICFTLASGPELALGPEDTYYKFPLMIITANFMQYEVPYTFCGEYIINSDNKEIKVPVNDTGLFTGNFLWGEVEENETQQPLAVIDQRPTTLASNVKRATLEIGQLLMVNEYLVSSNSAFFCILQDNGFLYVYKGSCPVENLGLLWSSPFVNSSVGEGNYYAEVTEDGVFGVIKGNQFVWSTEKERPHIPDISRGIYFLILQDDGNLCVYSKKQQDGETIQEFIWNSGVTRPVT